MNETIRPMNEEGLAYHYLRYTLYRHGDGANGFGRGNGFGRTTFQLTHFLEAYGEPAYE